MQLCLRFAMQIEIKTNKNVCLFGVVCKVVGLWLSEKVFLSLHKSRGNANK